MKEVDYDKQFEDGTPPSVSVTPPEDTDPLSPLNVHQVNAITLMRIYDMLGAILNKLDPEAADAMVEAHTNGKLVGPMPYIDM